jgi:hypothetical protein
MSLENLYNQASNGTYVGRVKAQQATDANTTDGVNFMDGTRRRNPEPDEFQTEFKRNREGTYADTKYVLSRWTPKSLKLAFEQDGPASLNKGYYTSRFRTATSPKGSVIVHNYTPLPNQTFKDKNSSAAARIASQATSL